jgi:hypothetical protein
MLFAKALKISEKLMEKLAISLELIAELSPYSQIITKSLI